MKKSKLTINDLFDKIREIQRETELLEDDLTVPRIMKELGVGRGTAESYLVVLVEKGVVKEMSVRGNRGNVTRVWRAV